ncbi:MAG: sugar ABC transporter permease [Pseudomonadota bacterium]
MKGDRTIFGFFLFGCLVTAVFILYPAYYAIELSFYQSTSLVSQGEWVGLDNYRAVLASDDFWNAFDNGLFFAGFAILLQVVLGIGIAMLLNAAIPAQSIVRGVAILPYLLPTVVVALVFKWMLNGATGVLTRFGEMLGFGTINWFETPDAAMLSVIVLSVWIWTPFVVVSVLAGLQSIPQELYAAAKVDGATAWQQFWHITLPQLRPVLTVVVLLRGIWMFNKFDIVWLMTQGGPLRSTEHLPILAYRMAFERFDLGQGAAIATISFLMLSAVVLVYFKFFPLEEKS